MKDGAIKTIAVLLVYTLVVAVAWWALGLVLPLFGVQPLTLTQTVAFIILIYVMRFVILTSR